MQLTISLNELYGKLELLASSYTQIQQLLYAANYFPELGLLKLELSQLHHIQAPQYILPDLS
jgi:hypothetical protein